ncbi:SitI3 family protein [Kitasatospora purpeofusca]|uniref:SitI3 family protein n=1 Tax=Kitasatospora purpeofusca TaxID=67352 RepID=UPI002A5A0542|nr:SitI3 family protein [Kitasatospora purpeofusca]MDY0815579.1 SitI3 family protein [Kitasatospora purpeofusca]
MALSYSFQIATLLTVPEAGRRILEVARDLGVLVPCESVGRLLGDGAVTVRGTWVRVVPAGRFPWGRPLLGGAVFAPTVSAVFRLDKGADIAGQQDDMVRVVAGVLSAVEGDAALHLDFEEVWLARLGGGLTLSERSDVWPAARLASVPLPFGRRTHEFDFGD